MKKRREGVTTGVTEEGMIEAGVTKQGVTKALKDKGVTEYHPILSWLIDPVRRDKLERICVSLNHRKLLDKVRLGAGPNSLPMDTVAALLDATG